MDAVSDPRISDVVVMSSAQTSKTEILLNVVGFHVHQDPAPMLLIQPTLQMAEAFSKDRLAPMVRDTPVLTGKIADAKSRDGNNTLLHKKFPGGHITLAGANSPASLASRPVRLALFDEVDRYPASAGTEGDPVNLGKKRTATFWNRKRVLTSTPTIKGISRIETAYEESDQRRYHVPCPECGHKAPITWSRIKFDKEDPSEVYLVCDGKDDDGCGALIPESEKPRMLRNGEWVADAPLNGIAGFHINELYSPWRSWVDIVRDFLAAKDKPALLQTFVNTSLGETWEEQGDGIEATGLAARREMYPAPVPAGAMILTAMVDVQQDRLEVLVQGNGPDSESWGVDYQVLHGDPEQNEVWQRLDDVLFGTKYRHESGRDLSIVATCVDSGFLTNKVYEYCARRYARNVWAVKGQAGEGLPMVRPAKKPKIKGLAPPKIFILGVDGIKGLIYSQLQVKDPGPHFRHYPEHFDEEFFQQLTAEKRVTKYRKGHPFREWVKIRPRNEALDCSVGAHAALVILNPKWEAIVRRFDGPADESPDIEPDPGTSSISAQNRKTKRRGGRKNFANSWRY